ncbi:E3 ubiquitin- ligase NRDP1 [Paramuricea clavata]|uniref:E3 ubiquitin- ligase NRDP1 n=1 Tax=Paramuricea clavata TaxID=317549 RepID=A0A7D9EIK4_PARCT|nr:E3 ubiquitin- ligase NRDP1 [Paramuricea clavata]
MACCLTEKEYGYDDSRFEKDVDENFHCSICYNVLKEPRMCRNNEHVFCLSCISEHLKVNSQTCPECNEHLSVDTLRRPRVLNNYLSKLKINCDHASRGCPELTCVEGLETHVANCGFAPVLCSNAECGMEINKRDKVYHETEVCEYRKVKCHDCGQIQEVVGRLEGKVEAVIDSNAEVKKEIKDVKENLSKVNKDVDEVKVMMSQMLEKFNMLELLSKLPSPTEGIFNAPREDILIAGGLCAEDGAELFSWEKNGWYQISQMNQGHIAASSFIYNGQLFVVGGDDTKTIGTLDLNELPLKWVEFSDKLPYESHDHQTVVYQQRVIHIGGYNGDEDKKSNVISELQLTSPCLLKELCQMPQPRDCHGAEAFEDKVVILGGMDDNDVLDSVLEFDPKRNECKELPSLPHPMHGMATVCWRDQVVVLGGRDKDDQDLNNVFMYDCKTGKITVLPSMLEKRYECCAVITGNTIVVMGGDKDDDNDLSSVECFLMGGSTWKYLPSMNNERSEAVAEVLPSTRKCVYV